MGELCAQGDEIESPTGFLVLSVAETGTAELHLLFTEGAGLRGRSARTGRYGRAVTIRVDPEGNETAALFDLAELQGCEVLEIGCGDGRLTWRYASRAAHVTAIEPFEGSIARAREQLRGADLPIVFRHVSFEDFAAGSESEVFDATLLSWSLC